MKRWKKHKGHSGFKFLEIEQGSYNEKNSPWFAYIIAAFCIVLIVTYLVVIYSNINF